jgi:dihydroorotate dehydrogenase (fumarate)
VTPVPRAFDVGPAEIEDIVVDAAAAVVASTTLPVVVKLTTVPALGHLALRLVDAGVRGLVLFGRTPVPDLDVETGRPVPVLPLSGPDELLSPLRWTAVLAGRLDVTIVTAGGVHRGTDLVKAVLAGADAVAVTSCLLRYGPAHVAVLRDGLARWLSSHGLDDVAQVRGRDCLAAGEDAGTVARARSTTTLVAATGELADRASMRAGSSVW